MNEIRTLIVRMATDNPRRGSCRIQGELKRLEHRVARSTIAKTLKEHGIRPAPERPTSWRTFLRAPAGVIAAADFFTTEVWTVRGLVTHYVLFAIDHATRAVEITGITTNPDSAFMAQLGRNLTDTVDGFLRGKRFLIIDRDSKFTERFKRILGNAGVSTITTSFQAPALNAIAERFVLSIKSECLNKLILFETRHLERAAREYAAYYNAKRHHQGIGNELIDGRPDTGTGPVAIGERLGGLLRHYHRAA